MIAEAAHGHARRRRTLAIVFVTFLCVLVSLTGCDVAAAPDATPVPTSLPTVTPTSEVTFQVAVTPVLTHSSRRVKPTPTPTHFVPPAGPYIVLHPNSGPPVDRTILVTGANFPHSMAISILWSLGRRLTPLSTTGYSDGHGGLRVALSVPASAPGLYRVEAQVNGVPYALAGYRIVSLAALATSVTSTPRGGALTVEGKKFVPGFQLTLIAYSTVAGRKPIVLGNVQVSPHGKFTFVRAVDQLQPGQYILRAWSNSSVAAEMAQTFFEVVV